MKSETDQILRLLFEQTGTAMVRFQPIDDGNNFIISEINQKVEEIEKVKSDEVVGQKLTDIWPGVTENQFLDQLKQVYKTGKGLHVPTTLYKDTRIQGYRDNTIIKLPSGNLLSIYQDRTEEKKLEESLLEIQNNYSSLIENYPVATIVSVKDKVVLANQESAKLFGYDSPVDLIGINIIEPVHPDHKKLIQMRSARRRRGETVPSEYQIKILTPQGETRYIENRVTLIEWEDQQAILGVFVNVTENVENQEKLNTIRQLTKDLSYLFTVEEIAETSISAITKVIDTDFSTFQIVEDDYLFTVRSEPPIEPLRLNLNGKGITVQAASTKKSVLINDTLNYQNYYKHDEKTRSELAVPIIVDNKSIAVLNVESYNLNNYSEQDQTILEIFSEDVGMALSRLSYMNDLLRAEQRFRHVLDSSPDPILVINEEKILYANSKGADFFYSLRPEDIVGIEITENLPHYHDFDFKDIARRMLSGGSDEDRIQFTVKSSLNESKKQLEGNLQIIEYENNRAVLITFRDITVLKTQQRRLEILHRHTLDLEKSTSFEEILDITKQALNESFNYKILDLVQVQGDQLTDLNPSSDSAGYSSHIEGPGVIAKVARTQESVLIDDTQKIEYVPNANDNYYRSELAAPVVINGETVMVINVENAEPNAFDLDDKYLIETFASHLAAALDRINTLENMESIIKERTDALRSFENRYENIIKTFQIGVFEYEYETNNIWLSYEFQNQIGFDEEYTGDFRDIYDGVKNAIHEDDRELLLESVSKAFHDYEPIDMEIRFVLPNSPEKWVHISSHPVFEDGKATRILGISIDVTQIKVLEEQLVAQNALLQELDEMKNQFVTTATHELRTPVASILGYVNYVLDNSSEDLELQVYGDLNIIQRNAQRLVNLTNDLLDVQRITTGRFEITKSEFDFAEMLSEILEELTPILNEKKQILKVNIPPEVIITADKIRISQVMINLIQNASNFTHEGGVLEVTVLKDEETVECIITDNGIGIKESDLSKLFKPFPSIRHGKKVRSTGLGLAISKGILELHDGKIWAESGGEGKGSTFHISLPHMDNLRHNKDYLNK